MLSETPCQKRPFPITAKKTLLMLSEKAFSDQIFLYKIFRQAHLVAGKLHQGAHKKLSTQHTTTTHTAAVLVLAYTHRSSTAAASLLGRLLKFKLVGRREAPCCCTTTQASTHTRPQQAPTFWMCFKSCFWVTLSVSRSSRIVVSAYVFISRRIDTLAASIVTAVRMCGACCGRVCVLAGVVVQQQGAWRRPTSLNFNNPVFPSVGRLTPTAENFFFDLDFFRQHKKWSIWFILSKTRLSKKAFFDNIFPTA